MQTSIRQIDTKEEFSQMEALLKAEGLRMDDNLDYSCGVFDPQEHLLAAGSCFGNTIRCMAVSGEHRGEGLLNLVAGHLMEVQMERGNAHLFLYTKPQTAGIMRDLGFYEITRVKDELVFMENRRRGFSDYCQHLAKQAVDAKRISAVVMNANPFTLGHLHLVEQAAEQSDIVHLFVLSENSGPIPFSVRKHLAEEGVKHLKNVLCHDSGPYMISSATFPSYFLKDKDTVIRAQAELDLQVFGKIARVLGIRRRYAGQEPNSHVTALYNQVMAQKLPEQAVEFVEIPRLKSGTQIISASQVRQAIHDGRFEKLRELVPESTYAFFAGSEGAEVCAAIERESSLIHY